MEFKIPLRKNKKLRTLVDRINADQELFQLWKCANVNAVDRSGISDHGEVHIRIVANAALRIIRLLAESGVEPSVATHHELTGEDAELIVVVAAYTESAGGIKEEGKTGLTAVVTGIFFLPFMFLSPLLFFAPTSLVFKENARRSSFPL